MRILDRMFGKGVERPALEWEQGEYSLHVFFHGRDPHYIKKTVTYVTRESWAALQRWKIKHEPISPSLYEPPGRVGPEAVSIAAYEHAQSVVKDGAWVDGELFAPNTIKSCKVYRVGIVRPEREAES